MRLWNTLHRHFIPSRENVYRPGILGGASVVFFLVVTLMVEGFLVASMAARESDGSFLSAVIASDIVTFTNTQRHESSLHDLHENALLDDAAHAKALDMASRGYFAHIGPGGVLPWVWITSAGYDYQFAGENLAVRFQDSKDVVNAWMASPTHRDNILGAAYTDVGIGVAQGVYQGQPATFVVQYLAMPRATATTGTSAAAVGLSQSAQSFMQSIGRQFVRLESDPVRSADWILCGIVALFLIALGISFFFHIDVQSHELLAGGALVLALAGVFLLSNIRFLTIPGVPQTAGIIDSGGIQGRE